MAQTFDSIRPRGTLEEPLDLRARLRSTDSTARAKNGDAQGTDTQQ